MATEDRRMALVGNGEYVWNPNTHIFTSDGLKPTNYGHYKIHDNGADGLDLNTGLLCGFDRFRRKSDMSKFNKNTKYGELHLRCENSQVKKYEEVVRKNEC